MKLAFGCIGIMVFTVVMLVLSSVANGYLLTRFWEWFVIPTFPAVPAVSLLPAMGLTMMARVLMSSYHQMPPEEKRKEKKEELPNWALVAIGVTLAKMRGGVTSQDLPPSVLVSVLALANGEKPFKPEERPEFPLVEKIFCGTCATICVPAFVLGCGWIIHSFI